MMNYLECNCSHILAADDLSIVRGRSFFLACVFEASTERECG